MEIRVPKYIYIGSPSLNYYHSTPEIRFCVWRFNNVIIIIIIIHHRYWSGPFDVSLLRQTPPTKRVPGSHNNAIVIVILYLCTFVIIPSIPSVVSRRRCGIRVGTKVYGKGNRSPVYSALKHSSLEIYKRMSRWYPARAFRKFFFRSNGQRRTPPRPVCRNMTCTQPKWRDITYPLHCGR